jgi:hypothetical protein
MQNPITADPHWPDGSIFVGDPHAAAARLDAEWLGWRCWYGDSTHRFWAVPRDRWWLLVEAETPHGLAEEMTRHTSAALSPASSVPRGRGAPAVPGGHRRALRGARSGSAMSVATGWFGLARFGEEPTDEEGAVEETNAAAERQRRSP